MLKFPDNLATFYNLLFYYDALRVFREVRPDIIHSIGLDTGMIGCDLARKFHVPFLLTEFDIEYPKLQKEIQRLGKKYSPYGLKILKNKEISICNSSDCVITISEENKNQLLEMGIHARIEVIPNGIDIASFTTTGAVASNLRKKYSLSESDVALIFHGYMSYTPNLDALNILMNFVLPYFKKSHPPVKLILMGPGLPTRDLETEGVIPIPLVPYEELPNYLSMADIAVVPLRSGSGIRGKIMEYFALGIPTVSTIIGAEGLPVKNGRDILLSENVDEEFLRNIELLIKDPGKRKKIGENGRKIVRQHLDWKVLSKRYDEIYEAILAEKPKTRGI
jgi:glycosyltransferase involved in cell wall biosynthesis